MERNNTYKISVRDKDYEPSNNTSFNIKEITKQDLRNVVKKNNYSLITWDKSYRLENNFKSASGITVDVDNGLTVKKAIARLQKNNLNYFLVTSKSHTEVENKFHILIFFTHTVYSLEAYKRIGNDLFEMFPEADPKFRDGARFIFGSPDDSDIHEYWNGEDFDVSGYSGLWDRDTELLNKNEEKIELSEDMNKTPIFCPFHDDGEPSAFVAYNGDNYFIHCSSCNKTFWMYENREEWLTRKCKNFYSYCTDVFEFSMVYDSFAFNKIGKGKFHVFTDTDSNNGTRKEAWNYLLKSKHISQLCRIDYISDINSDTSYYEGDLESGVFTVHHRALPSEIVDNDFIEKYLENRFRDYKGFIKQWLAVYCYTNYMKLPSLIFSGPRGSGKSSFAEIIAEIFPSLSYKWAGTETAFSYEVEKKFLIVEENQGDKLSQYKTLKNYSGSQNVEVKKKFKDPYLVKNNMNICLLSNEAIPLFVRSEEMPSDSKNNQFFVYEFPQLNAQIDPQIQNKVIHRLGHYIRTELKTVFNGLNMDGFRYSIDVPITEYEKALFENNITESEQEVEEFVTELTDTSSLFIYGNYQIFIEKGQIPVKLIKEYKQYNPQKLIKGMIKMKYITGKAEKAQIGGNRQYCYKMTDKLFDMIKAKPATVSGVS